MGDREDQGHGLAMTYCARSPVNIDATPSSRADILSAAWQPVESAHGRLGSSSVVGAKVQPARLETPLPARHGSLAVGQATKTRASSLGECLPWTTPAKS
ncbi:uncharacterized protein JN550_008908 [Neoarthrinium moseri]|uniref:uncharacterized protein n=1 Tax=Neoarthrinium moseri TaxID=1658444 RepID=UPI001FDCCCAE|nr:uncharacterized protein JN550_008908 [Neoarthrinium moseri]KAI1864351.1 hypothetical protein JN550_008908 [Neoarthrinium moseri]